MGPNTYHHNTVSWQKRNPSFSTYAEFSLTLTFLAPWYTCTCACQQVRNVSSSGDFAYVLIGWSQIKQHISTKSTITTKQFDDNEIVLVSFNLNSEHNSSIILLSFSLTLKVIAKKPDKFLIIIWSVILARTDRFQRFMRKANVPFLYPLKTFPGV